MVEIEIMVIQQVGFFTLITRLMAIQTLGIMLQLGSSELIQIILFIQATSAAVVSAIAVAPVSTGRLRRTMLATPTTWTSTSTASTRVRSTPTTSPTGLACVVCLVLSSCCSKSPRNIDDLQSKMLWNGLIGMSYLKQNVKIFVKMFQVFC